MQVVVSGKHLDIGESLRNHIIESMKYHVQKFFDNAIKSHVTISKEHNIFKIDIIVNEGTGTGIVIKSNTEAYDPYKAFDIAIVKLVHRLRKYKTKIKNHHKKDIESYMQSIKYVITRTDIEDDSSGGAPVIIAEKPWKIEKMSVADAVMHMDLKELPAYMFINNQTNTVDVVYYRKDGNISWISGGTSNLSND